MVKLFPLDYMHLICFGVVKSSIRIWDDGKKCLYLAHKPYSDEIAEIKC